jgi:hypothetical protein
MRLVALVELVVLVHLQRVLLLGLTLILWLVALLLGRLLHHHGLLLGVALLLFRRWLLLLLCGRPFHC